MCFQKPRASGSERLFKLFWLPIRYVPVRNDAKYMVFSHAYLLKTKSATISFLPKFLSFRLQLKINYREWTTFGKIKKILLRENFSSEPSIMFFLWDFGNFSWSFWKEFFLEVIKHLDLDIILLPKGRLTPWYCHSSAWHDKTLCFCIFAQQICRFVS